MTQKAKVSVIIPTHSGFENINRAVDSALNQTYKNIEVFVIDDNGRGTENQIKTEEQMEKYRTVDNVTYLVHEKNINGSAARNTGIRASVGDYIAFLDDDDVFLENNIEEHIKAMETSSPECGITYCGMKLIVPGKAEQIILPRYDGDILFDFLCGKIRIGSSLIMVKREAIDYVKEFDESFTRHQDWEFIVRILDKYTAKKLSHVGVRKYNLNRNSAKNPEKFEKNRMHYLNKMKYIIDKFDNNQQKKIYNAHYSMIGKEYLRAKKLKICIKWTNKTSNPIKTYVKYFIDAAKAFIR